MKGLIRIAALASTCMLATAGCGGGPGRLVDARRCLPELDIYDWQRLDASTLLVWSLPAEQAYRLDLADDLEALESPETLELVDGNGDGMICSAGWDALAASRTGAAIETEPEARSRQEVTIELVTRLAEDEVDALQRRYARTRGRRVHGMVPAS